MYRFFILGLLPSCSLVFTGEADDPFRGEDVNNMTSPMDCEPENGMTLIRNLNFDNGIGNLEMGCEPEGNTCDLVKLVETWVVEMCCTNQELRTIVNSKEM